MFLFQTNIGLMLHSQREFNLACKYLEHSCNLQMKFHGAESLHTATGHHLVARALSALGNYKKALSSERSTHSIYEKHVRFLWTMFLEIKYYILNLFKYMQYLIEQMFIRMF